MRKLTKNLPIENLSIIRETSKPGINKFGDLISAESNSN